MVLPGQLRQPSQILHIRRRPEKQARIIPAGQEPVSYTHLDVYKRQQDEQQPGRKSRYIFY